MLPLLTSLLIGCDPVTDIGTIPIHIDQEDRNEDGSLFTPNTQSFLRGHHWLDGVSTISIQKRGDLGEFSLEAGSDFLTVQNLDMTQLVPRLHYPAASPPDDFDALNLMLAEYSRNGLTVPYGAPGDSAPHFETSLDAEIPWTLAGAFDFQPEPRVRPLRFGVVNNCLAPGLWELNAKDRAGEVFHAWFSFPDEAYVGLVSQTNGLPADFTAAALQWRTESVPVDLDRLRTAGDVLGEVSVRLAPDSAIGFSSQSSRRKLSRNFVQVGPESGEQRRPTTRMELVQEPVHLVDFVPPGNYDIQQRRIFDLGFLGTPRGATVHQVTPKTHYEWNLPAEERAPISGDYIEINLDLTTQRIVLGNLPLELLVPQEDFSLHGFGVGILAASTPAERRRLLLDNGPAPSFAYLLDSSGEMVLNSHDSGIEQIFIRAHVDVERPYWEITVTSFERIVDLVRLQVEIPDTLHARVREISSNYISPTYLTYRDDNIR